MASRQSKGSKGKGWERERGTDVDELIAELGSMKVEVIRPGLPRHRRQRMLNRALLDMIGDGMARPEPSRRTVASSFKRYVIRLDFVDIEPKIWRRFTVPGDLQARDLVKAVRSVAGWSGVHLDALHFPRVAPSMQRPLLVEERLRGFDTFSYTYDFGDGWSHQLFVEAVERTSVAGCGAVLISGERACPPDDCGGPSGYARLCRALSRKRPGSGILRWLKEVAPDFDPEAFDVRARNARLLSRLRLRFGIPRRSRGRRRRHR